VGFDRGAEIGIFTGNIIFYWLMVLTVKSIGNLKLPGLFFLSGIYPKVQCINFSQGTLWIYLVDSVMLWYLSDSYWKVFFG